MYDVYAQGANAQREASLRGGSDNPYGDVMSYEQFAAASPEEQFRTMQGTAGYATGLNNPGNMTLGADDDLVKQFQSQFGTRYFDPVEMGDQALSGYEMGWGDPMMYDMGADDFMQDSSRVLRLPDGRYIMESGNRRGDAIAGAQSRDSNTGLGDNAGPLMLAAVLTAGLAGGALGVGAEAASGAGAEAGLGLDALETFTAANPGWEAAYQAAATAAPETAYGLDALESVPFEDGMAFEQSPIPSLDELGVNPNTGGGTFEGTGWTPESAPTGNPFSARDMIRGANTLRSVLGGGGGGQGQGQGGMPIMGGFGSAPRIGDHKQDNDPFGLKASGWGGGFVKEDPKQKIAQALMERNPWSYTG